MVQIKRHTIHSRSVTSLHSAYTSNILRNIFSFHHFVLQEVQTKYNSIYSRSITTLYSAYKSNTTINPHSITSFHRVYTTSNTQSIPIPSPHSTDCTNQTPYNPHQFHHFISQVVQIKHHTIHSHSKHLIIQRVQIKHITQFILVSSISLHSKYKSDTTIYFHLSISFHSMYKPNTIQSILVRPFHSTGSINQTPYNLFSLQHFISQTVQTKHITQSILVSTFHSAACTN